jgi:cysteine protease ATG4
LPQTLGCIGGKPNHAHYFIGYLENDELLYLDPHVTQAHVDPSAILNDSSYHCDRVNRMKFTGLDPSLALVRKLICIALCFSCCSILGICM